MKNIWNYMKSVFVYFEKVLKVILLFYGKERNFDENCDFMKYYVKILVIWSIF